MSFKLIREGTYTYKRVGKKITTYRVKCRQDGFAIDQPILDAENDTDAIKKARRVIAEARMTKKPEKHAMLVRIAEVAEEVILAKPWLPTRNNARYYIEKHLLPWFNINCPFISEFTEATWDDFCAWHQMNRPGQKLFNPRKYMSQIVKRAQKKGLVKLNIQLKNPDPKRQRGKIFTDEEIVALYTSIKSDELRLQFLMALTMGMRRSEILRLQWPRIHFDRRTIELLAADCKIREGREFRVTDEIYDLLAERWKKHGVKSLYLFPSPGDPGKPVRDNKSAWQGAKRLAKVKGRFHDLRHTFITQQVAKDKKQALDVAVYCGLSLEELKRTYLHPTPEDTAYIALGQRVKIQELIERVGKTLGKIQSEVENA